MATDPVVNRSAFEGASAPPASPTAPEQEFENVLRPRDFTEFVGQRRVVENLSVALEAALARDEALDHVLLSGPPGLGKTSLARILSRRLGTHIHLTSGPALERSRDLIGILTQLKTGDVLFIDEVHRTPTTVQEFLYSAMEDFRVDFTLDQGPNARILPLSLAPFTLIGATTREGLLSAPFRNRFGILERLSPYSSSELVSILERSARILGIALGEGGAEVLAMRARGTPRIANRFLRRARDLAQVEGATELDGALASDALRRIGVDAHGLEELDRRILSCLAANGDAPVGLKTIAAAVGESEDTIEEVFEPHLLRSGLLLRTARGRMITAEGREVIGSEPRLFS